MTLISESTLRAQQTPNMTTPADNGNPAAPAPEQLGTGPQGSPQDGTGNSDASLKGETPPAGAENPKPKEEDPRFSSRFAALSRKDKELRAKERAIKEHEASLKDWQESQKLVKENPLAFMKKTGLTLEQLITLSLQQPDEPDPVQRELAEVKQKIQGWDKQYEDALKAQAQAQEAAAEAQSKETIRSFVKEAGDKYELIANHDAVDEVYDLILEDWMSQDAPPDQRRPMSIEKAAQAVEDYYFEEAQRYLKANKVRAAIQPGPQNQTPNAAANRQDAAGEYRAIERPVTRYETEEFRPGLTPTLTNGRTAGSSAGAPKGPLTDTESLKRAVSLLKFS